MIVQVDVEETSAYRKLGQFHETQIIQSEGAYHHLHRHPPRTLHHRRIRRSEVQYKTREMAIDGY